MDYLRVLLVPFQLTSLLLIGTFTIILSLFAFAGLYGILAHLFLSIWLFKYCYFVVEQLADGAREPPVMSVEMLSPFEIRPWVQAALIGAGIWFCLWLGAPWGQMVGILLLLLLPASIALLGAEESYLQAVNPIKLALVVRGLGPYYALILIAIVFHLGVVTLLNRLGAPNFISMGYAQFMVISVFSLIGASMFVRRKQLGLQPTRSPERAAERAEAERIKRREKMVDEVFQLVRIGKHVEATAPLAQWFRNTDNDEAVRDGLYVAERAVNWGSPLGLNTIGSTLIRHLLRTGRADAALSVFETLRAKTSGLTLDSAPDLRILIDYAMSIGREELAASMRLETPIFRP